MKDEFRKLDLELLHRTLFNFIEEREGVEIKFKIERRNENGVHVQERES